MLKNNIFDTSDTDIGGFKLSIYTGLPTDQRI